MRLMTNLSRKHSVSAPISGFVRVSMFSAFMTAYTTTTTTTEM